MKIEPIRVLHVLGGLKAGGAESFVINLYRAIDKNLVQFDFVKHIEDEGIFESEIVESGGRIYRCPKYNGKNHFAYCKWWDSFFKEHPEYNIVHGHVRSTASLYLKIAKEHGLVTIAHSHSTSNGSGISAIVKNIMQYPIRYVADYLFACSDKAGAWLYGKKAIRRENYKIVPNGVDLRRFAFNEEKRVQIRHKLGILDDTFVIGHIGRFTFPKNHKFLVELFAEYHKKNVNSKLLLVGDGEESESVRAQCVHLGVSDSVIMVGSKTNTEDYYQAMDVFAFPSLWEGLGIVAIEAQANGLICLLSENIPCEAVLTENIKVIPLKLKKLWIKELKKIYVGERMFTKNNKIKQYDVYSIANRLEMFYLEQSGREM